MSGFVTQFCVQFWARLMNLMHCSPRSIRECTFESVLRHQTPSRMHFCIEMSFVTHICRLFCPIFKSIRTKHTYFGVSGNWARMLHWKISSGTTVVLRLLVMSVVVSDKIDNQSFYNKNKYTHFLCVLDFTRFVDWNEQHYPTDAELIWNLFCVYLVSLLD